MAYSQLTPPKIQLLTQDNIHKAPSPETTDVNHFLKKTGLKIKQLEELLCQDEFSPQKSRYLEGSQTITPKTYGATYINAGEQTPEIKIQQEGNTYQFKNMSPERLDRLYRFVRLQSWSQLPCDDIDIKNQEVLSLLLHWFGSDEYQLITDILNRNTGSICTLLYYYQIAKQLKLNQSILNFLVIYPRLNSRTHEKFILDELCMLKAYRDGWEEKYSLIRQMLIKIGWHGILRKCRGWVTR